MKKVAFTLALLVGFAGMSLANEQLARAKGLYGMP